MGIKLKIKQAISFLLHGEPDIVQVNLATLAPNVTTQHPYRKLLVNKA